MSGLKTLEHVAVTVSITHPRRGSLELKLFCPSGMMSLIGAPRSMDSYVHLPTPELPLRHRPFQGKGTGDVDAGTALHCHGPGRPWQLEATYSRFVQALQRAEHYALRLCPSNPIKAVQGRLCNFLV